MKSLQFFLFGSLIFITSCQTSNIANLYLPSTLPYYLLSEKGDYEVVTGLKFNHLNTRKNIQSLEVQGAYAFTHNTFLSGGFSHFNRRQEDVLLTKQTAGELAFGTYVVLEKNENSVNAFEFMGGYGFVAANQTQRFIGNRSKQDDFSARWNKFFFQMNYGYQYANPKGFRLSIGPSLRVSILDMFYLRHVSNYQELDLSTPDLFIHTLGLTLKIGRNNVQALGQVSTSFPFGKSNEYQQYVDSNPPIEALTLGITAKF